MDNDKKTRKVLSTLLAMSILCTTMPFAIGLSLADAEVPENDFVQPTAFYIDAGDNWTQGTVRNLYSKKLGFQL